MLSRTLLILAIPVVFVGLIDPLEGGIAMLLAGVIYFIAFQLAGHGPKKYLWVPYVAALVVGVLTILLAIISPERNAEPGLPLPTMIGLWTYRVAVLATLSGAITTAIFSFRNKA